MARRLMFLLTLLLPILAWGEDVDIEREVLWDMTSRASHHTLAIARQGIYRISVEKVTEDTDSFLWMEGAEGGFWKGSQSITALLEPGLYELSVVGTVVQAEPYRMVVARMLNVRNGGTLDPGERVKGLLFPKAVIAYTFTLDDFAEIELTVSSYPRHAGFTLGLENDYMNDWAGTIGDGRPVGLKVMLPPGVYTVLLKDHAENDEGYEPGVFDLSFSVRAVSHLSRSTSMSAGQTLAGVISNGQPWTIDLEVERSAHYSLGLRSPDFLVCGSVTGPNGFHAASHGKSARGIDRRGWVSSLAAGHYKLTVQPCDKKGSGSFMVNVAERR